MKEKRLYAADEQILTRNDLEIVEEFVREDVRVLAVVVALRELLRAAQFPIADLDALLEAIPSGGLRFRGFTMSREEVRAFAPEAVFPIESREKLVSLAAQAVHQLRPPQHERVSLDDLLAPNICAAGLATRSSPAVTALPRETAPG